MSEPRDRPAASSLHGDREPEVSVRTVRLEELFAILRRHARLVVGVVAATVAAAGVVAYVTGPAYRAVAVIRMSDPRRALTGGVVLDPARADERSEEHTSELQSRLHLVCRLLLEKKKKTKY